MRYGSLYYVIPAISAIASQLESTYQCLVLNCSYSSIVVCGVAIIAIVAVAAVSTYIHLKLTRIGVQVLGLLGYLEGVHLRNNINDVVRYEETHFADLETGHALEPLASEELLPLPQE